jgi:hypothetical protein
MIIMRFSILTILFLLIFFTSCKKEKADYSPDRYLSVDELQQIKRTIVRYAGKAPRRVVDTVKFDSVYDTHYEEQVDQHELIAYFIDKQGEHFFLISRIAPSIQEKWVATGGRMRFDENRQLADYEEVFRTWKLPKADMLERSRYLFDLMVNGKDLTPYYAATAGFNYIEFPDENVYFDKKDRIWKSKQYGSVEEMVYESRDRDSLTKKQSH